MENMVGWWENFWCERE